MANLDEAKFEAAVEKICAQWVGEMAGVFKAFREDVLSRTRNNLQQKILTLKAPEDAKEKELVSRVNEIISQESRPLKDLISVELAFTVDEKSGKLGKVGFKFDGVLRKMF